MKSFKIWLENKEEPKKFRISFKNISKKGYVELYINDELRTVTIDGIYASRLENLSKKSTLLAYKELLRWIDAGDAKDITYSDEDPRSKIKLPRPI